jgi:hypothetical protein
VLKRVMLGFKSKTACLQVKPKRLSQSNTYAHATIREKGMAGGAVQGVNSMLMDLSLSLSLSLQLLNVSRLVDRGTSGVELGGHTFRPSSVGLPSLAEALRVLSYLMVLLVVAEFLRWMLHRRPDDGLRSRRELTGVHSVEVRTRGALGRDVLGLSRKGKWPNESKRTESDRGACACENLSKKGSCALRLKERGSSVWRRTWLLNEKEIRWNDLAGRGKRQVSVTSFRSFCLEAHSLLRGSWSKALAQRTSLKGV